MNRVLMVTNLPLKCGGATSAMYTGTVIDATPTRINEITVIKLKEILHPFSSKNIVPFKWDKLEEFYFQVLKDGKKKKKIHLVNSRSIPMGAHTGC